MEVPPLGEKINPFVVLFLVPKEYNLLGVVGIHHTNEILRSRARTDPTQEPIFCSGPTFHVHVIGTL